MSAMTASLIKTKGFDPARFRKKIPGPLILTGSAVKKVKQLIDEEGNPKLKLRVFIQGGGCSGYQYGFTFDEAVDEGDTVLHFPVDKKIAEDDTVVGFTFNSAFDEDGDSDEDDTDDDDDDMNDIDMEDSNEDEDDDEEFDAAGGEDFRLLVDSVSYHYLVGAQIDYKDDLHGAQFVIKNPNATTTCGCGSSFSV